MPVSFVPQAPRNLDEVILSKCLPREVYQALLAVNVSGVERVHYYDRQEKKAMTFKQVKDVIRYKTFVVNIRQKIEKWAPDTESKKAGGESGYLFWRETMLSDAIDQRDGEDVQRFWEAEALKHPGLDIEKIEPTPAQDSDSSLTDLDTDSSEDEDEDDDGDEDEDEEMEDAEGGVAEHNEQDTNALADRIEGGAMDIDIRSRRSDISGLYTP